VSLARLLEMKDPDTAQHSARVAQFSRDLAEQIGLSKEEQSRIHLAGLLHDVGKVGVPDEILLKQGRLTDEERTVMQRHARLSAEAIAGIPGFSDLTRMVYAHHERIDGSGYPEAIGGADLPIGARILGVADTFEALTSDRPYRVGRSAVEALKVFREDIHLFDPNVVDALHYLVVTGALEWRTDEIADFSEEWSNAARYLDVKFDEEQFQVPPERPSDSDADVEAEAPSISTLSGVPLP
jgi:putative nucleotidyltransferase with HDIG domain